MKIKTFAKVVLMSALMTSTALFAQEDNILELSLEDLMNMKVITASKSSEGVLDAAAVITVISEREIATYGARHLMDVLDRVVGANTYGKLAVPNSIYSVRGTTTVIDNLHILVLIDGRPTRESFRNGQYTAFYQAFPVESIKRVEVIRGPGSVLYGSGAYMGVVNIITKKGNELKPSLSARYGSGNSMQFSGALGTKIGEKVDIGVGFNYLDDGGWDFSMMDERNIFGSFEFRRKAAGINLNLNAGNLRMNAFAGQNTQNNIANRPIWAYDDRKGADSLGIWEVSTPRIFVNTGYDLNVSDNVDLTFDVTYNRFEYHTRYIDVGYDEFQNGSSDGLLFEATSFISLFDNLNITLGGSVNYQTGMFELNHFNADGTPRNILTNTTLPDPPFTTIPRFNTTWLAAYAQADYQVTDRIKLVSGVQLNKVPDLKADLVPRIATIFKFTDHFAGKLMVSNAFRSAIGLQSYVQNDGTLFGNPNLSPEKNNTYEAQLMHKTSRSETSLTFVHVDAKDLIGRSLPQDSVYVYPAGHPNAGEKSGTPTFINKGTLKVNGVELESKVSLSEVFYTNLGVSYYTNEDDKNRENQQGTPSFMFKLGLSYNSPKGVELGLFNTFAGETESIAVFDTDGNQTTLDNNPSADAYNYLTGNLSFDLNKLFDMEMKPGLKFSLYGVNLLDSDIHFAEYARRRINTMPGRGGRQVYASLRARF